MKFKTITYQRVKNLGNYESERLELSVELDDDEDVNEAMAVVIAKVYKMLEIKDEDDESAF
jgi:small-conductance mechanosensitive channel